MLGSVQGSLISLEIQGADSYVSLQKVLRSLEVAGELLEELSKLGKANQAVVQKQCEEYLQNLKANSDSDAVINIQSQRNQVNCPSLEQILSMMKSRAMVVGHWVWYTIG